MTNEHVSKTNVREQYEYRRKKNAKEMKLQVVTFALMIFLTLIAFMAVGFSEHIPVKFIAPFILLLAIIQVIFQLYYFMHANHKGHELPMFYMYCGAATAFLTILAFCTIVWW
ncbi:cytochrome c oxidase subunit IVB [Caldibacillus lycopersici]|uniref:Cytochrome c oxidase subunit IVB n=1 Tax=Perspicuibacillus lycopersici TaxID=1325689 RepID=A0AAE3IPV9_9BACI|nr:cytochrome c oxidase subunit IVB [Perspicuibacillus lycopersici]MCU9612232.1 cytochrome c oxidase subunit IVB [Perspicuibacillus lycopersici]